MSSHVEGKSGYSFHFSFPTGLKLVGTRIDDNGIPRLLFDASPKVPTVTEEDCAAVFRLVYVDRTRPSFFFSGFIEGHPFCGRWYLSFNPEWLRYTELGELFLEADWSMKSFSAGVRSNDAKDEVKSLRASSNLEGLADRSDFPIDGVPGSMYMTCQEVRGTDVGDGFVFNGEPKMRIVDEGRQAYTKYATEMFDSIAYHDEPRFLKIKEIVKLIVIAEWLCDRKVPINIEWVMEKTKPTKHNSQPDKLSATVNHQKALKCAITALPLRVPLLHPSSESNKKTFISVKSVDISTPSRAVIRAERSSWEVDNGALVDSESITIQATIDDFDWLYKGTIYEPRNNFPVVKANLFLCFRPDCRTLAELYERTLPIPFSWQFPYCGIGLRETLGGVDLRSIPVKTEVPTASGSTSMTSRHSKYEKARQPAGVPLSTSSAIQRMASTASERKEDASFQPKVKEESQTQRNERASAKKQRSCKTSTSKFTEPKVPEKAKQKAQKSENASAKPSAGGRIQRKVSVPGTLSDTVLPHSCNHPPPESTPTQSPVVVPPSDVTGTSEVGRRVARAKEQTGTRTVAGLLDPSTGAFRAHNPNTGSLLAEATAIRTRTEVERSSETVQNRPEFSHILVPTTASFQRARPRESLSLSSQPASNAPEIFSPVKSVDSGISTGSAFPTPSLVESDSSDDADDPTNDLELNDMREK